MTPAVDAVKKARITHQVHQYVHDPCYSSFGAEAADKLGVAAARVFKTLVVQSASGQLMVAVVPVTKQLDLKRLARATGEKKAVMADAETVERATGYVLGGISPLGQKRRLPVVIDQSASGFSTIYVSGGRRGLELELAPDDLLRQTGAAYADIAH